MAVTGRSWRNRQQLAPTAGGNKTSHVYKHVPVPDHYGYTYEVVVGKN
jgi:hypothetical protein